jgi:glycosyltransferase involved in cell wall biosynthesis
MKISIIIPTRNSEKTIKKCLESFENQAHSSYEIIVVDGKSSDSTIDIIQDFKDVRLLKNVKIEAGHARNRGAEIATGQILFFCDSDSIAHPKVLEYHSRGYKTRDNISGVMGSIHNASPKNAISKFVQKEIMASQWLRSLNPDGTIRFFHTGTTNFSIYRSEFLKWKFREDPTLSEDTELSIRVSNKLKILFEPRAVIFHHHPATLTALFNQRKKYGERFPALLKYCERNIFEPDSLRHSALRYIDFTEDQLSNAIIHDNRLLCKECKIGKCRINVKTLSKDGESDEYLCQVVCFAFASGILKKRTGIDYSWQ